MAGYALVDIMQYIGCLCDYGDLVVVLGFFYYCCNYMFVKMHKGVMELNVNLGFYVVFVSQTYL